MNLAATVNVVLYDRMAKMMANQEVSGAGTGATDFLVLRPVIRRKDKQWTWHGQTRKFRPE